VRFNATLDQLKKNKTAFCFSGKLNVPRKHTLTQGVWHRFCDPDIKKFQTKIKRRGFEWCQRSVAHPRS
jgi:hypothetical protein